MARRKLGRVLDLEKARTRLAAVKSIDPALDLGNNITATNYEAEIVALTTELADYNTALSKVDDLYNICIDRINNLKDWNERILTGVATKYGKNSSQYEMAGGVKKSERKKGKKEA
jgi:pantothenate kinase-related protein Tda10